MLDKHSQYNEPSYEWPSSECIWPVAEETNYQTILRVCFFLEKDSQMVFTQILDRGFVLGSLH